MIKTEFIATYVACFLATRAAQTEQKPGADQHIEYAADLACEAWRQIEAATLDPQKV